MSEILPTSPYKQLTKNKPSSLVASLYSSDGFHLQVVLKLFRWRVTRSSVFDSNFNIVLKPIAVATALCGRYKTGESTDYFGSAR